MTYQVFISYSADDFPIVDRVKRLLESEDVKVFVAEYSVEPGQPLADSIKEGIRQSDLFVLLWSRHSEASDWVPQEIGIAKDADKPIIPVVLEEDVNPPAFVRDLKYLPAYRDPGEALSWLRQNVLARASKKQRERGMALMGLGALVVWLFSQD